MRRSAAHEDCQADTTQAVVCAGGTQVILATNLIATPTEVVVRDYQTRHWLSPLPPARPTKRRYRVDLDRPRLQLQAHPAPADSLTML